MNRQSGPILTLPETVRQDTLEYRSHVEKYLNGQTSPTAFRAYRVPMGIYEQRTEGEFMVRIRIGAGLLTAAQARKVAQLSKKYGNGIIHITTRQDVQIHQVPLEHTSDILEQLLEVGLSARGGGGNTVRNVTACPRCGVCSNENFNVGPYSVAVAEYLIQNRSSFNLPRKYKIVFSGCSKDCASASVADLGFFAKKQNGHLGFSVYAGGGLGSNPNVAVKIEDFVKADDIFLIAETIKQLFDEHGDRSNKHKARLRYVLKKLGQEKFIALYKSYKEKTAKQPLPSPIPQIKELPLFLNSHEPIKGIALPKVKTDVLKEKQDGFYSVRLNLKLGDIPADDFAAVADISEKYAAGIIRTTQLQNLLITSVAVSNLAEIDKALNSLSIDVTGRAKSNVVACAGAATCKLGLCLSRGLASAISDKLNEKNTSTSGTVIRISGCPNSCGHHIIADVGFQGRAKRISERLMPCYDVLIDGKTIEGKAKLAEKIGTVPAKSIPDILAKAFENNDFTFARLKEIVDSHGDFSVEFGEDYFYDYGKDEPFTLAGRGPGECGAGVMDVVRVDIDQAKAALKAFQTTQQDENLYNALISAARALLIIFGSEPKKDREIIQVFTEHLIKPGWVSEKTSALLDAALDWKIGDKDSLKELSDEIEKMVNRIEELFFSLDANLKFKIAPIAQATKQDNLQSENKIIDLRGVACPLNFVKAKLELEKVEVGQILDILLDDGEPIRNVPESFTAQGQEVIEIKQVDDYNCVKVKRIK